MQDNQDLVGEFRSPGGFVFGVQGWTWGEQRPTSITFFLNGTAKVFDQHGRPIKGTVKDGRPIYFDKCNHAQVIAALAEERVDWTALQCAGWPQLPYAQLKALKAIPPWPFTMEPFNGGLKDGLPKIPDPELWKDAKRVWEESRENIEKELQVTEDAERAVS